MRGAQEVVLLESAGERGPGPGSRVCALLSGPTAVPELRILKSLLIKLRSEGQLVFEQLSQAFLFTSTHSCQ